MSTTLVVAPFMNYILTRGGLFLFVYRLIVPCIEKMKATKFTTVPFHSICFPGSPQMPYTHTTAFFFPVLLTQPSPPLGKNFSGVDPNIHSLKPAFLPPPHKPDLHPPAFLPPYTSPWALLFFTLLFFTFFIPERKRKKKEKDWT